MLGIEKYASERSVESSLHQFARFLCMVSCKIHWATHTIHQNTEEMLSLPYIWCKGEQSAFEIHTTRPPDSITR